MNCKFGFAQHPRFGFIGSIVAIKDIQAGEELLVDYKLIPPFPQWYEDAELRDLFNEFYGQGLFARLKSLKAQGSRARA